MSKAGKLGRRNPVSSLPVSNSLKATWKPTSPLYVFSAV
jgi:hypothetical protein